MKKRFLRALAEGIEEETEGPIRFVASTEDMARDGLIIEAQGWQLEDYRLNPVVLWAHDYWGERLPLGRAEVEIVEGRLIAEVVFDQADDFARQVEGKYRRGFLNAVSVGWNTLERSEERVTKAELLDISAVPVPADPNALMERQRVGLRSLRRDLATVLGEIERGAHPPHTTAKAPEDTAWDGSEEVGKAEGEAQLWRMHAWRDDGVDPELKRAYKLPHHLAAGEVVWRGVAAAMARLLQAGTQIPESDRRGVYNHLARHYKQFDKEAPEFRMVEELAAMTPELLRGLFLEGEAEIWPELFGEIRVEMRHLAELKTAYETLGAVIAEVEEGEEGEEDPPEDGQIELLTGILSKLEEVTSDGDG